MEKELKNPLQLKFGEGRQEGTVTIRYSSPHVTTESDIRDLQFIFREHLQDTLDRLRSSGIPIEHLRGKQRILAEMGKNLEGSSIPLDEVFIERPLLEEEVIKTHVFMVEEEKPINPEILALWEKDDPGLLAGMTRSLRARMDEEPVLTGWQRELLNFSISEIEKNIPK